MIYKFLAIILTEQYIQGINLESLSSIKRPRLYTDAAESITVQISKLCLCKMTTVRNFHNLTYSYRLKALTYYLQKSFAT